MRTAAQAQLTKLQCELDAQTEPAQLVKDKEARVLKLKEHLAKAEQAVEEAKKSLDVASERMVALTTQLQSASIELDAARISAGPTPAGASPPSQPESAAQAQLDTLLQGLAHLATAQSNPQLLQLAQTVGAAAVTDRYGGDSSASSPPSLQLQWAQQQPQ